MKSPEVDEAEPGGDLGDLREQNLRRILGSLFGARDGLTQPKIVDLTGLSRSTVSSLLVHRLDPVLRTGTRRNGENSGRPVKAWAIDEGACLSIGVDMGQTHVSVAAINPFGELVAGPNRKPMNGVLDDPHGTLSLATRLVEELAREEGIACGSIAAITVGLPGPVDKSTGVMADDATRAWAGIDVREEIRKRWPHATVPQRLADNNANLGALAEHRLGAGRGTKSLIVLDWSSGIGAGIVLDGRLWRGRSGVAGELGHQPVRVTQAEADVLGLPVSRERWRECPRCGQVDCLDRLAGGRTVAAAAKLPNLSRVVSAALAEPDSEAGDRARLVLSVAARLIGRGIGPTLTLLNVDAVILGGAVGRPAIYPLLVEDLDRGISETAFRRARTDASLDVGALGVDAPVLGAGILGLDVYGIDFLIAKAEGRLVVAEPETEVALISG
jgi:predicted NBD/HSP70 family sugar kinase